MQVKDKLIAITGAGKGIGRAMSLLFASRGAHLALMDVNDTDLQHTASLCSAHGVKAGTYRCNVASEDDVIAAFDKVASDFKRLDVLINNAGILRDAMLVKRDNHQVKKMSLEHWQQVIDVNLTGVFLCGREAAEHMIKFGNGGVIINLSSISRAGNIGQSNYAAAKAGVASLTVVWAKELARYGIRTGAIAPGFIHTDILNAMPEQILQSVLAQVPLRRGGQPEEVAAAAAFIVENDYFSGRVIELDGGLRL
ncbi:MAG TPA: SDR family oxidoreductase [Steroidobacteraceae bacterium]|nr:SDR family oxidoreductase [Steroidobacteraceae bacterium]